MRVCLRLLALLLCLCVSTTSVSARRRESDDESLGATDFRVEKGLWDEVDNGVVDEGEPDGATLGESGFTLGFSEAGSIVFPTDFSFTIDPFQSGGGEQVFSQPLVIVNNNPYPVWVELTGLIAHKNDPDVQISGYEIPKNISSPDKDINLWLRRCDQPQERIWIPGEETNSTVYLTLGASDMSGASQTQSVEVDGELLEKESLYPQEIELPPTIGASSVLHFEGAVAQLEITGSVNPMPRNVWRAGDVSVSMILRGFTGMPLSDGEEKAQTTDTPESEEIQEPEPESPPNLTLGESGDGDSSRDTHTEEPVFVPVPHEDPQSAENDASGMMERAGYFARVAWPKHSSLSVG